MLPGHPFFFWGPCPCNSALRILALLDSKMPVDPGLGSSQPCSKVCVSKAYKSGGKKHKQPFNQLKPQITCTPMAVFGNGAPFSPSRAPMATFDSGAPFSPSRALIKLTQHWRGETSPSTELCPQVKDVCSQRSHFIFFFLGPLGLLTHSTTPWEGS